MILPSGDLNSRPDVANSGGKPGGHGKICRWHDYSNVPNITENAPAWWLEHIMKAAGAGEAG